MSVFTVYLNVAGKDKIVVGNVALDNPSLSEFKSMELVEQDAESSEDAISVAFLPT